MNSENKQILEQIQAVIFDLDGVLVDTAVYHYKAWKRIADRLGFDFTAKHNEELKGVSRVESLNKILYWAKAHPEKEEVDELLNLKNGWYLEYISQLDQSHLLPGSEPLLKQLKRMGKRIALGSASKNAPLILERTGIVSYFDVIVDGNVVQNSKPDPEVFLKGAELLGIHPSVCLVLEDAQAGVTAATRAGMFVIGVSNGEPLEGTHGIVKDLNELVVE